MPSVNRSTASRTLRPGHWHLAVPTALVALVLLACPAEMARPDLQSPPNVVVVMTDDQGYGDFSLTGNPILRTPNLDALAAESAWFTDFHVAPSCTATRGQLLTGLDSLRNGASSPHGQRHLLRRGLRTMADEFAERGYRTALYGKWHLGGNTPGHRPHERGFQDAVHYLRGGVQSLPNYWNSDLQDDYLLRNGSYERFEGYATDVWFDLAEAFVRQRREDGEPFLLYLPLNAPHGPLLAPDRYREPYRHLDKETATFFAMIATVDDRIGRFVALLSELTLRDSTILVFLTDNGTANGEEVFSAGMRGKKGSLYDGGHRVPLFVSWPGGQLRPPGKVDALTHVQDLLPTLLDLCNLNPPPGAQYDGVSLAPLLRTGKQPALQDRAVVVQQSDQKGRGAVLWRNWRWVGGELYDLSEDPAQVRDLAGERPDLAAKLAGDYERWWAEVEPGLGLEPYPVGMEPQMLTSYDWWHGPRVYNWPHLRRGDRGHGRFEVRVERPGRYRVALRRWPRESGLGIRSPADRHVADDPYMAGDPRIEAFPPGRALDILEAGTRFGTVERRMAVEDGAQEIEFEFVLEAGLTEFETWFVDRDGERFGAYYAYVERMEGSE